MKDQSGAKRRYGLSLLALGIVLFALLAAAHDRLPMWVEGMPEYEAQLSAMLGMRHEQLPCALRIGSFQIPLAVAPYVGGGFIYLHAPFVAAWYYGLTGDPYFYRFAGILAFLIDGWLIFFISARTWGVRTGWWAAALWLTTPNLFLVSVADLQFELIPLMFLLGAAAFFLQFLRTEKASSALAAALLLGMAATTRIDPLVLLLIAFFAWVTIIRPATIVAPVRASVRRWKALAILPLICFAVGASPFIAYNIACPSGRIVTFLSSKVLGRTFGAGAPSLGSRLWTRIVQYFSVNVLHEMPFLSVTTPNYLFMIAWVAAVVLVLQSWRRGQGSFPLFALAILVPLSLLSTGVLRPEHMISFQVLTSMMVASGLTAGMGQESSTGGPGHRSAAALLALALAGNVIVLSLDWRSWQRQSVHEDSITNQSAPVLLFNYLRHSGTDDRLLFTNIGLAPYIDYLSAGKLRGEDFVSWNGTDDFVNAVTGALRDKGRRRIFVAVSPERDGGRFNFVRTSVLYDLLRNHAVPYTTVTLSSKRRENIYDIVTVQRGQGIDQRSPSGIGVFRGQQALFALAFGRNPQYADVQFQFGQQGDVPLSGDWTNRGITSVGVYRPSNSTFYLRNINSAGDPDLVVRFGRKGDIPLVGDWDGNGTSTVGIYRPASKTFYLRNSNEEGPPDITIILEAEGQIPVAGDWDGDGITTTGLFDRTTATFSLRNSNVQGPAEAVFSFGKPGDLPIAGDWNGNGTETIGVYRPSESTFYLRDSNTAGPADRAIPFGIAADVPVVGHWNG
ncbi:MAG: hypothetical protein ABI718_00240 [Acidobacteriota bacterium]